ncbi:hypothetical protein ABMA27_004514 [Loxostege sticticalis]|uniref:WKF domain-containing protein n=1 Tax=Loxostege sticticalis TaxID=481309 RepID=A0ABR3HNV7_LOXSC
MGGNNKKKPKSNKKRKMKKAKQQNQLQNSAGDDHELLEKPEALPQNEKPDLSWNPQKRHHADDDSESENEPKRKKKKKKQIIPDDTSASDKKNKKSIRQMKKEKFAQRQAEMEAASKEQLKSQCLNYLSQWKHNRSNWKFMKAKQVWLYKNKFSQKLVPNETWPLLMEYFESAQGNIRNMLLNDANKIIKQMDDWTESQDGENSEDNDAKTDDKEETTDTIKPDDTIYKRARDLIQCLQEYSICFISFYSQLNFGNNNNL